MAENDMMPAPRSRVAHTLEEGRITLLLDRMRWRAPLSMMLAALAVAFSFYLLQARPQAMEHAQQREREASDRVLVHVNDLIGQTERVLLTSRDWARQGLADIDKPAAFNQLMMPLLLQRNLVTSIHLADDQGREIMLLKTEKAWKNRLTDVPRQGRRQHWLHWQDAATPVGEEWKEADYDPRQRPWFTGALATAEDQVHWTAPYQFATTKAPGITAAVRWKDAASGRQYVIAFDLLLTDLSRFTRALSFGAHGQVAVLTGDNKLIGLPALPSLDDEATLLQAVLKTPEEVGLPVLAEALSQVTGAVGSVVVSGAVAEQHDRWWIRVYALPWGNQAFRIATWAPEADFFPWPTRLLWILGVLLAGVLGFGVLMSRQIQRDIGQPLKNLFFDLDASNRELNTQILRASVVADLAPALQSASSYTGLAEALLSGINRYLPLGQGSLYRLSGSGDSAGVLRLCGAYAHDAGLPLELAPGEGLTGQCVRERQAILLEHPPVDYVRVFSALAEGAPTALWLLPVMNNDSLLGVVELATFHVPDEQTRQWMNSLLPLLALCMEIQARNARTQDLLAESRRQAAELVEQQALVADNEARMKQILEDSPAAVTMVNESGEALFSNRRLADMLGVPVALMRGRRSSQFWAEDNDRRRFIDTIKQEGRVDDYEARFRREDGREIWVLLNTRWIVQRGHKLLLTWMYDITERKMVEEAMRQAHELAAEAARAKSDFLANMSHEIRTPLNAIIGMAHLTLNTELNPRQREYLTKLNSSSQHLLGIVNDILDFSSIEAGKLTLQQREFDLDHLLDDVVRRLAPKLLAKGLYCTVDIAPEVPRFLHGDPERIGQVLGNYASNAIKFTDRGGITLLIQVRAQTASNSMLYIAVRDTGIGLNADDQSRLFAQFQQIDSSTTRKYGGMGMGLSIAKRLSELMGGEVGVASELGQGSTFWFTCLVGTVDRENLPVSDLRGCFALQVDARGAASLRPHNQPQTGTDEPVEKPRIVTVDRDNVQEIVSRLIRLLAEDDAEAGEVLVTHSDVLSAAFPEAYFGLDLAIRNFDYEQAVQQLRLAAQVAGIEVAP